MGAAAAGAGSAATVSQQEKLNRKTPRDLPATEEQFKQDEDGNMIYNSPYESAGFLTPKQGDARKNFGGTCGLCSVANILRLSGVNVDEGKVIDYASVTDSEYGTGKLCETGNFFADRNGATSPTDRKEILEHFGINSSTFELFRDGTTPNHQNIDLISKAVSEGRGVIISVYAGKLWNTILYRNDPHAVSVTSVKKDSAGNTLGFFIHDSAFGKTTYYPAERVLESFTGSPINITNQIIR